MTSTASINYYTSTKVFTILTRLEKKNKDLKEQLNKAAALMEKYKTALANSQKASPKLSPRSTTPSPVGGGATKISPKVSPKHPPTVIEIKTPPKSPVPKSPPIIEIKTPPKSPLYIPGLSEATNSEPSQKISSLPKYSPPILSPPKYSPDPLIDIKYETSFSQEAMRMPVPENIVTNNYDANSQDSPAWVQAKSGQKRKQQIKNEVSPKRKKKSQLLDDDQLVTATFWNEEVNCATPLKNSQEPINVDLFAEAAALQIAPSKEKVKISSKEEILKRGAVLEKRRERANCYEESVRNKKEREKMTASDCEMCRKFYEACESMIGAGFDKGATVQQCSRHRAVYETPPTPPGYWDVSRFFL